MTNPYDAEIDIEEWFSENPLAEKVYVADQRLEAIERYLSYLERQDPDDLDEDRAEAWHRDFTESSQEREDAKAALDRAQKEYDEWRSVRNQVTEGRNTAARWIAKWDGALEASR